MPLSAGMPAARRWFLGALAVTLIFRGWLAATLPVTADEAYFVLWGRDPDVGYYDHPPMVGWMLAPLLALSEAAWVARLPATLAPAAVALGVRWALVRWFDRDEETAWLAALAVLLVPMNVWNVLVTTDTPLVVFGVASALAFARAAARDSARWFAAAGALLGLAFLAKYFAVLLGLAYLVWGSSYRRWARIGLVFLAALPFGVLNLYWNWQACWSNVMFNAINRHQDDSGWSFATPALYAAALAYLAAPLLWYAWRRRARLAEAWRRPGERALLLAWLVPLAVFALLSPVKRIGLHWLLSFVPLLALSIALAMGRRELTASVRFFIAFALLHAAVIGALALVPLEAWNSVRLYPRLVFLSATRELLQALEPDLKRYRLAADSYSSAALLSYHANRSVAVFGTGSSHARQDDIRTDWRTHAGADILIVRREAPLAGDYAPYFRDFEFRKLEVRGVTFHAVLGRGFDYEAYRSRVLHAVRDRYYRIPAWLPVGRCSFFDRYFTP